MYIRSAKKINVVTTIDYVHTDVIFFPTKDVYVIGLTIPLLRALTQTREINGVTTIEGVHIGVTSLSLR